MLFLIDKHYIFCCRVIAYLLQWIVTPKIKLSKNKSHCLRKTLGKHYYTRWKAKLFELRSRKVIDDCIIFQITESEYHKLCVNRLIRMHRCGNVVNILNTRDSGKRLYFIPFVSRWAVFIPEIILVLIKQYSTQHFSYAITLTMTHPSQLLCHSIQSCIR